jgi:uncharacterized protein YecT (DUF1311 family)
MNLKGFYIFFVIVSVAISNLAFAEDDEPLVGSQLSINFAAESRFVEADDEMNRLYKMLMGRLSKKSSKNRLRDAQRAWIVFRDNSCLYEAGAPGEGGSIGNMAYSNCKEHHTTRRIEDLKQYIGCDADTDPTCPL